MRSVLGPRRIQKGESTGFMMQARVQPGELGANVVPVSVSGNAGLGGHLWLRSSPRQWTPEGEGLCQIL